MNVSQETIGLENLAPVEIENAEVFLSAAEHGRVKAWLYYFPLLHFYGRYRAHLLRWESYGGSILIYRIRRQEGRSRMDLYLPPFPWDPDALRHARQRMREFNGDRAARIVWVQESDALSVARAGFGVFFREEEFIYDRKAIMGLEGSGFRKLRQNLSSALRLGAVETRPYTSADQPACLAVLEKWRERLTANGIAPNGYSYTLSCLEMAKHFPPSLLSGMVIECDGVVRGFAFTGQLSGTLGCNFIGITDTEFQRLSYLLSYRIMAEFPDLLLFNDSSDTGRPGLHAAKKVFNPVEMHGLYGARER